VYVGSTHIITEHKYSRLPRLVLRDNRTTGLKEVDILSWNEQYTSDHLRERPFACQLWSSALWRRVGCNSFVGSNQGFRRTYCLHFQCKMSRPSGLQPLPRILEIVDSNHGPDTSNPYWSFCGFIQSFQANAGAKWNQATTASFRILSNSSFTYSVIRLYIIWVTEKALLNTLQIKNRPK